MAFYLLPFDLLLWNIVENAYDFVNIEAFNFRLISVCLIKHDLQHQSLMTWLPSEPRTAVTSASMRVNDSILSINTSP